MSCSLGLLLALVVAIPGFSADVGAGDSTIARIRATLHERFPEVDIRSIAPAGVSGLYEVVTANEIVYADASAAHLISGRILDTRSRTDLTAARWDSLHAIDFATLPLELAIKTVRGDGSRRMAIFADPHCPYCAQLERDTRDLTNVTIYTFLFPLENLHPGAEATARRIWCSKDRAGAWSGWMLERAEAAGPECDDDDNARKVSALAEKLGVAGTPTLFFASGRRHFGAATTAQLEKLISAH